MKFCPNCGAKNESDLNFCAQCGAALKSEKPVCKERKWKSYSKYGTWYHCCYLGFYITF